MSWFANTDPRISDPDSWEGRMAHVHAPQHTLAKWQHQRWIEAGVLEQPSEAWATPTWFPRGVRWGYEGEDQDWLEVDFTPETDSDGRDWGERISQSFREAARAFDESFRSIAQAIGTSIDPDHRARFAGVREELTVEHMARTSISTVTTINARPVVTFHHTHGGVSDLTPWVDLIEIHTQLADGNVRRVYDLSAIGGVANQIIENNQFLEFGEGQVDGRFRIQFEPIPPGDPGPTAPRARFFIDDQEITNYVEPFTFQADHSSIAPSDPPPLTERNPDDSDYARWASELDTEPYVGADMPSEPQSDDVPDLLDRIAAGVRDWENARDT